MLRHKMSLNKSKISEILSIIFSDQNGEKFETNKKKAGKQSQICGDWTTCYWTSSGSIKKSKNELKIPENNNKKTHKNLTFLRCSKGSTKSKVYSNTGLLQEI